MQKKFSVGGMHCTGCEHILEQAVSALDGVKSVRASYSGGEIKVRFDAPCTEDGIRRAIENAGYTNRAEAQTGGHDGVYILIILVGLFVIAQHLGLTELFNRFPTVDSERVGYAALFVLGLFTSVHCIAMCGGINLSQSVTGADRHSLARSFLYNLGRLVSYTLIGGVLGLVGEAASVTLRVRGCIGLAAGIVMVLMGVNMLGEFPLLRRLMPRMPRAISQRAARLGRFGPFSVGLVNGFMPCGPLQSMQIYSISTGGFAQGALSMFFFCLGTIPLVLGFGLAAGILKMGWKRRVMQVSAALLFVLGLFMVRNNLALTGFLPSSSSQTAANGAQMAVVQGGKQYITTELRANGYDDLQVEAGIPVVWTINADESALNGCNQEIILPEYELQVTLHEGENVIEFTPEDTGSYSYSCWMGMLRNTITVV